MTWSICAGEKWDERLRQLIDEADVFQLFWSTNSMHSPYVRQEWEHALVLERSNFIRPTYWEIPMPGSSDPPLPPEALRRLHFHWLACETFAIPAELSLSIPAQASGAPAEEATATKPVVTPAPTAAPEPPLDAIDVFISYSHAADDKKWVVEVLEPLLIQNGCRVCRDDQIPGGEHWRHWIHDQIAASRHVVVVLTKSSVESSWVKYELEWVVHEDPVGEKSKLVPIWREACDVPDELISPFIQRIDLTVHDPGERERQMISLVNAVRPGRPERVKGAEKFSLVTEADIKDRLLKNPKKVADFRAKLGEVRDPIDKIEQFKRLHDGLHKLIDRCPMVDREIKKLSDDDASWEDPTLAEDVRGLASDLEDLVSTAQESPFGSHEGESWIKALDKARSLLEEAFRQHDKDKLTVAMTIVNTVRGEKFNRFNTRLFEAAALLKFDELLASVEGVLGEFEPLESSRLDERAARRRDEIRRLWVDLKEVGPRWVALIHNHNLLQRVHEKLNPPIKDEDLANPSLFLILYWDEVTDALGKLTPVSDDAGHDARRTAKLEALRASAAAVNQAVVTAGNPDKGGKALEYFQNLHGRYFTQTDSDLMSLCPKLVDIGKDLKTALEHLSDVD